MAPVTLPPSFYNSFWSPDYRTGLEVLFKSLEQGCLENDDIITFIESQAKAHTTLSASLLAPPRSSTSSDSTTSLQHTLLSLRGASSARGEAHRALALELEQKILDGFRQWAERHEVRIQGAKDDMLGKGGVVKEWEREASRLASLRQTYLAKSRAADESEDDAKFAPATSPAVRSPASSDSYTASPQPHAAALRRAGTVADRISEKLRQASVSSAKSPPSPSKPLLTVEGKTLPPPPSPLRPSTPVQNGAAGAPSSPTKEDTFIPPSSPDGRPSMQGGDAPPVPTKNGSVPPIATVDNTPILLSGLSLTPKALKDLLQKLDTYLLTTPAPYSDAAVGQSTRSNAALASRQRSTILGTYEKTFSGEEVVAWLRENMEGFGGDWDRCVDAAGELHKMGYLSRIGVGRGFDANYDTHFILKQNPNAPSTSAISPLSPAAQANIQNMQSVLKAYLPAGLSQSDEPVHVRLRREAIKADEAYREGVRTVEARRLEMEEMIERGLRVWERWERERLGIVKSVLKQYEESISSLTPRLQSLAPSTALSVEAFNPEADLKALIEGNRTGPFRPTPQVYDSIETEVPDVNFGIDLRRWAGEGGWKSLVNAPKRPSGSVPDVLSGLLEGLEAAWANMGDDDKRKCWIYEVPLYETHALRNMINDPAFTASDISEAAAKFNVPVIAGAVKLWLLELSPPVMGWEGWEDAKAVYPQVGADRGDGRDRESAVRSVVERLPGVGIYVLDKVLGHWRKLIDSTSSAEPNDVYTTKLALSLGRTILRPQTETELTIQDRTPSLFLADLINLHPKIFPDLVNKKKREGERVMPVRKRTALVDQRISRSRLSAEHDPRDLLERRQAAARAAPTRGLDEENAGRAEGSAPDPAISEKPSAAVGTSILGLGTPIAAEPSSSNDEPPRHEADHDEARPPVMAEPDYDSDSEPPFRPPQSPAQPAQVVPPMPDAGKANPEEEEMMSPTADFLESYEGGGGGGGLTRPESLVSEAALEGAGAGLKRAGSGEASRLRGPRGARGPRPAGGRVPSYHASKESIGGAAPAGEAAEGEQPSALMSPSSSTEGGLRRNRALGHGTKSSVSDAIARFEGRG